MEPSTECLSFDIYTTEISRSWFKLQPELPEKATGIFAASAQGLMPAVFMYSSPASDCHYITTKLAVLNQTVSNVEL